MTLSARFGGWVAVVVLTCVGAGQATASTSGSATEPKALHLYLWSSHSGAAPAVGSGPNQPSVSDFLAPDTLAKFEQATGIKVTVTNYASDEELGAQLAAGNTEYDLVLPSAQTAEAHIKAGYYQKLDKTLLPNLKNVDPQIQARLALHDPGNEHLVTHMWGTFGVGYDVAKVKELVPEAPLESWSLLFDPHTAAKLRQCGLAFLGAPTEAYHVALAALGKNPNSQDPRELEAATRALLAIKPFLRSDFSAAEHLASGDLCVAVTYNLEVAKARRLAAANGSGRMIAYSIPKEGSLIWFDTYAIPKGAPHPRNAHTFINYMLRPEPAAAVTNALHTANAIEGAERHVDTTLRTDPAVYPGRRSLGRLTPDLGRTPQAMRIITAGWERFSRTQ